MRSVEVSPAKVVIIGGGIVGVSMAARLAQKGVEEIYLLERNKQLGMGETAASAAMLMFNTHKGTPSLVRLAAAAMREYGQLKNSFGFDPEIKQCGSILISTTPEGAASMKAQVRLQKDNGIRSEFLSAENVQQHVPSLNAEGIKAGIYCPVDGYLDQMSLVEKFGTYAKERGVNLLTDTMVTEITESEGVVNVQTEKRGPIPAERIIIAAGAQSPELSAFFKRELPLTYSNRTLFEGSVNPSLTTPIVEVVDGLDEGFYLRPAEGKRCIIGVGPTIDSREYPTEIKPFYRKETTAFLKRRFPRLAVEGLTGIVGTRTMTADELPYLGQIDKEGRVFAAYGLSGYGITLSPVLARYLADFLVEGRISKEMEACLPGPERLVRPSGVETE